MNRYSSFTSVNIESVPNKKTGDISSQGDSYVQLENLQLGSANSNEKLPLLPHEKWLRRLMSIFCGTLKRSYDPDSTGDFKRRLGTFAGVIAPIALGQFGNNLFLRT
ncbi:hypothetical protein LOTGIDRAFT_168861, partial [Lottia gigantea]